MTIEQQINSLIEYWKKQSINIIPSINSKQADYKNLPADFLLMYSKVNGMFSLYPNDTDNEGFLFYPVEAIFDVTKEYIRNNNNRFIFADYLQRSWFYAFDIKDDGTYIIGIIALENQFKPITNSLAEFIDLYINDSDLLYQY